MFTAFIAVALELVALTAGAMLLLATYKSCYRNNCAGSTVKTDEDSTEGGRQTHATYRAEHHHRDHQKCYGFFKTVSIFTMVLSFLALISTCIALGCFLTEAKRLERDRNAPVEQYNRGLDKLRKYSDNYGSLPRVVKDMMVVPSPTSEKVSS